ncbi:MAG TPA: vWA domain-containing protein [Verrucomicrobiae bacterium]|nr:vWA domain-containing protein [Verrucomicrobiae bacterium]
MTPPISSAGRRCPRRGQTLVLFALSLVVLLALTGLGIDGGLAYVRRARLNKAVDAAAIVTTRHIGKPEDQMRQYAYDAVHANDLKAVVNVTNDISIVFERDVTGLPIKVNVGVKARGVQPMTFMRVLGFNEVPVAASAEAVRFPIAMALIIDRSGSMTGNDGSTTIPATIPTFLSNFVPGFDTVGIYSYSWTAVRELGFTTNFQSQAMRDLFNTSDNRIKFAGNTGPGDCLRMALQDMEQLRAYNEKGVKKIVVFMTDGKFNTFRTRPPNIMGAFSNAPPGTAQSWWEENYLSEDGLYSSTAQGGTDGSGMAPKRSQSGPSYNFSGEAGGFTFVRTNSIGSGVYFRNLDAVLGSASGDSLNWAFATVGTSQYFKFNQAGGGSYTNCLNVPGKLDSASGYGSDYSKVLNDSSIGEIHTRYRFANVSIPGDRRKSYERFVTDFRFLSADNGKWKAISDGDNIRAEARTHALRYCAAARKTRSDPRRVTIFTIGFGSDTQLDTDVLKKMANLNPGDSSPPYSAIDPNQPYDETFGFTLARNPDELNRTYIALGIYLATRLTK